MLIRHGYGVLLFDRRGEGESDGDPNAWGWGGDRDLQAATAWLAARPDVDPGRIGGLGLSVGGELMIETAAEHGGLAAVASEGAGIRSMSEFASMPAPLGAKLLVAPFKAVSTAADVVFTGQAPPPNLVDLVPDVGPTPLLLMYSPSGQGGEVELNPEYHRRAPGSELWAIHGAGHMGGIPRAAGRVRAPGGRILRCRAQVAGVSTRSCERGAAGAPCTGAPRRGATGRSRRPWRSPPRAATSRSTA